MQKHKKYSAEFKKKVLAEAERTSAPKAADTAGVHNSVVYAWIKAAKGESYNRKSRSTAKDRDPVAAAMRDVVTYLMHGVEYVNRGLKNGTIKEDYGHLMLKLAYAELKKAQK